MRHPRPAALAATAFATLALVACGGGGGTSQAEHKTFDLQVTGTTMKPSQLTAHQGDTVTISITTDKEEEIHLHGYDRKFEGKPGSPQKQTFTADKTGNFTIELEESGTKVGELDVYPR
jgi:plastocyanin